MVCKQVVQLFSAETSEGMSSTPPTPTPLPQQREDARSVPQDRATLLSSSWTYAAKLYAQELVPRFAPWTRSAYARLLQHDLPDGPVLVPCCGPGHELVDLHRLYAGRRDVIGLDLAPGMIELAKASASQYLGSKGWCTATAATSCGGVDTGSQDTTFNTISGGAGDAVSAAVPARLDAVVADATSLEGYGPAAAVLSVFGLQQMGALAPKALASWVRALAPGGVCVVMLWPSKVEEDGPWACFDQVVAELQAEERAAKQASRAFAQSAQPVPTAPTWEDSLLEMVPGEFEVIENSRESHEISWPSAEVFWEVMTEGGPWRARTEVFGRAHMDALGSRFKTRIERPGNRLRHFPSAQVLVIRRPLLQPHAFLRPAL